MRGLGDGHDAPFRCAVDSFGHVLDQGSNGKRDGQQPFWLLIGFAQTGQRNLGAALMVGAE